MPPTARLITDDGDEFILDQSTDKTLLRYENRAEVWVLHPTPGSHGDVVFRNDIEQPVLRTSRWGGITAFTPDRPTGEPVLITGPSPPLPVLRATPLNVWHILVQASFNVRQAVSHPVAFEAPDVAPGSEGVIADAAIVSSDAIVRLASDVVGRARLAFLRVVQFHEGKAPNARYSDGVMEIVVVPGASYAGRPSSMRVAQAVLGK